MPTVDTVIFNAPMACWIAPQNRGEYSMPSPADARCRTEIRRWDILGNDGPILGQCLIGGLIRGWKLLHGDLCFLVIELPHDLSWL